MCSSQRTTASESMFIPNTADSLRPAPVVSYAVDDGCEAHLPDLRSILERLEDLEKKVAQITNMERTLENLQKQVRRLQRKQQVLLGSPTENVEESMEELYNGLSRKNLENIIAHKTNLSSACKALLLNVFSEDYLITHSITGRRGNTRREPKPMMDERIIQLIRHLLKEKFGRHVPDSVITEKIQNVQKVLRLKYRRHDLHLHPY